MKRILIIILAICISLLYGFFFLKRNDITYANPINEFDAYVFQLGVFRNYDNAVALKENNPYSEIFADGEFFRVYIAISNYDNKDKLYNYYSLKGVNFFVKKIVISSEFYDTFNNYQFILNTTDDIDLISNKLVKEYVKFINGI